MSLRSDFMGSALEGVRRQYRPPLPLVLQGLAEGRIGAQEEARNKTVAEGDVLKRLKEQFPTAFSQKPIQLCPTASGAAQLPRRTLRVGVVLSGGQAAGGHNVIVGMKDFLLQLGEESRLIGFLDGPKGIIEGKYRELEPNFVDLFRNQGGFHMIGSGRNKVETQQDLRSARNVCENLNLDGLVVIGGDDSNTNACVLAEEFAASGAKTCVIGCPKTIDGDLKNQFIETSFGFDTATRIYSEAVANLQRDAQSSGKYYNFVRVMGRSASHIALEVAMQCHSNACIIGEEIREKEMTLQDITNDLCDMIVERKRRGLEHGSIIVPEGLIEFIPEVGTLIRELNDILASIQGSPEASYIATRLSKSSRELFEFLPSEIRSQLLLDRDPHGNVAVSQIETEKLLIRLCEAELGRRKDDGSYSGNFMALAHFLGYEGRSGLPSDFDCNYCYALGFAAGALILLKKTGMMASVRGLSGPVDSWKVGGCPIADMMTIERRKGRDKPVIEKALVKLDGGPFRYFASVREDWKVTDSYRDPAPLQFAGPLAPQCSITLEKEWPAAEVAAMEIDADQYREGYDTPLPLPFRSEFAIDSAGTTIEFKATGRSRAEAQRDSSARVPSVSDARYGIVLCGRQTPGVHSAIAGLVRCIHHHNPSAKVVGFKRGTLGFLNDETVEITKEIAESYKNRGGFHLLGRTRDSLRTGSEREGALAVVKREKLNGLVLVGGTATAEDARDLHRYFTEKSAGCGVIFLPATVNNDFDHSLIEVTLGFDTASKVMSQLIGNVAMDAISAKKYWFFVRTHGQSTSHIALECALKTHPNIAIISEVLEHENNTLRGITDRICDVVCARSEKGKDYGVVLVPEGLASHLQELSLLLDEVRLAYKRTGPGAPITSVRSSLSEWAAALLESLPVAVQESLLRERETRGTVNLSQIETERLLAVMVKNELERRKRAELYSGKFNSICHFFGYQTRCAWPSNFDITLGFYLGATAAALLMQQLFGYAASVRGVVSAADEWQCGGISLQLLAKDEKPCGVDVQGRPLARLRAEESVWALEDAYQCPGPIQFEGPTADFATMTIEAERLNLMNAQREVAALCEEVLRQCRSIGNETAAAVSAIGLRSVAETLRLLREGRR